MTTKHDQLNTDINAKIALDKKDLTKCWRSWMMYNLSSMSFERLESFGFCLGMMPALKKLYPQ